MPPMAPNAWHLEIETLGRGGGAGLGSFRDGFAPWRPGARCSPASPGPSSSACRVSSCQTHAGAPGIPRHRGAAPAQVSPLTG